MGFRIATIREALRYESGLNGYVKNLSNGDVEAIFAGDEKAVLAIVAWCKKGPSAARVKHLEVYEEKFDQTLPSFIVQ